jgi:hypothetical protein
VLSDGEPTLTRDLGRPELLTTGSLGGGWDFEGHISWPFALLLRLEAWGRYPVNERLVPQVAISLGASVPLRARRNR